MSPALGRQVGRPILWRRRRAVSRGARLVDLSLMCSFLSNKCAPILTFVWGRGGGGGMCATIQRSSGLAMCSRASCDENLGSHSVSCHACVGICVVSCPQLEVVEVALISLVPLGGAACPTQGPLPWEELRGDWHGPFFPAEEASRARVPLLLTPELGGGSGHVEGRKWRPAGRPVV